MNLSYFFWSSKKKQGFKLGELERPRYITRFSGPEGKETNIEEYVTPIIDIALQGDLNQTEEIVSKLNEKIKDNTEKIKKLNEKYNIDLENQLNPVIQQKNDALKEKANIEAKFSDLSVNVEQKLSEANEMLNELKFKLSEYCEDCKKYWEKQGEQIKNSWNSIIDKEKNITWNAIKDSIVGNEQTNDKNNNEKESYTKDLSYFFFFILMCIYDVVFGYKAIEEYNFFSENWKTLFVALFFIPIIIGIVHVLTLGSEHKSSVIRMFCKISLIFSVFIIFMFVLISLGTDVNNLFSSWEDFISIVTNNGEVLFRATIIPAILAGEILINLINRDNVREFFGRYFKRTKKLNFLLIKGIATLKENKLSDRVKKEKASIEESIDGLKKQSLPDHQSILDDISIIDGKLSPIYNSISGRKKSYETLISETNTKIKTYDETMNKIKTNSKKLLDEETNKLKIESEKYSKEIEKAWNQFNNKKEEFKNGFVIGLNIN